jgi:hypothetical protein
MPRPDAQRIPGMGAVDQVRRLGPIEPGVDRDEHSATAMGTESGEDPLQRVRGPHRDPFTWLDTPRHQGLPGPLDLDDQFIEIQRQLRVAEDAVLPNRLTASSERVWASKIAPPPGSTLISGPRPHRGRAA